MKMEKKICWDSAHALLELAALSLQAVRPGAGEDRAIAAGSSRAD
jgi:hypothetical protein